VGMLNPPVEVSGERHGDRQLSEDEVLEKDVCGTDAAPVDGRVRNIRARELS
jgi:hypothetical protein